MPTKSLESDATIKSSILSISSPDLNTIQMQMKQYTWFSIGNHWSNN